ncbi:MAG TPA: vanadium-dependent haloperoxidase [Gaiellaceae bacterium]
MKSRRTLLAVLLGVIPFVGAGPGVGAPPQTQCAPAASMAAAATPVAYWSTEARCATVPAGPGGAFGAENFGNKFPGEAAVYMGIVHVAIYDAAVAVKGGYRPYALTTTLTPKTALRAKTGWSAWASWRLGQGDWKPYGNANPAVRPRVPRAIPRSWWTRLAKLPAAASTSSAAVTAAIATAAYDTLAGLQPTLRLDPTGQAILHDDYTAYLAAIPDGPGKESGTAVGHRVAQAVLAKRANDGLEKSPTVADLGPPPAGPGVWQPSPLAPALGLRLPGVRPLALQSASQFRPDGPNALTSKEYADDLNEVERLGRADSASRTPEQTIQARFWTDHDIRQWNDGMLRLAAARGLGLVQTARMLALAHVAGGDAMIACFEAKYHYWFWRPFQAIPQAGVDGNPATESDPSWQPLAATPNFPEYPSAHACHSTAVVAALDAFFGTDQIPFTLDSRITRTTRQYGRLQDIVDDVDLARVLVGFHFRNSDLEGSSLGRDVGRYVASHLLQPIR